jgi:hypothetical protein
MEGYKTDPFPLDEYFNKISKTIGKKPRQYYVLVS